MYGFHHGLFLFLFPFFLFLPPLPHVPFPPPLPLLLLLLLFIPFLFLFPYISPSLFPPTFLSYSEEGSCHILGHSRSSLSSVERPMWRGTETSSQNPVRNWGSNQLPCKCTILKAHVIRAKALEVLQL